MKQIRGEAQTVKVLLGQKYEIDFYQREYQWETKQILELIQDLTDKFREGYESGHDRPEVKKYPSYFLGSIIISEDDVKRFIVDGQQRLTSLTLLLIYLRHKQGKKPDPILDGLIYSSDYGEKNFNLHVEERIPYMNALFKTGEFKPTNQPESVKTLAARYQDIKDNFPLI